ncbi:MAG TPA: orotidine-5'-phosphate decarboxylase [Actinomycetota bacterium]|nr:orotidine-5'-phosphate decarboxylase [Actinomycetota bacterium]
MEVPDNPICVALDAPGADENIALAAQVAPHCGLLKVGLTAFVERGPSLVAELRHLRPVFLDLKLHDIPAQVNGAAGRAAALGVSILTIHAAGGAEMISAAAEATRGSDLTIAAVTVLTSLDDASLEQIGLAGPAESAVLRLADIALGAGAGALVCSPLEVAPVRSRFGTLSEGGPLLIVPGIRPAGSDSADQRRTLTPREALEGGADILVIGRPITAAPNPERAAQDLAHELAGTFT